MNFAALKKIRFAHLGRTLALLVVFWAPFSGGPRLFSALLAIMGAWLVYRERAALFTERAYKQWLMIFLLLWIPLLISTPTSIAIPQSLNLVAVLPLYFLAGLALIHSLRRTEDRLWLARGIGLTLALWVLDGLLQYLIGRDLVGVPLMPDGRIVGPFADNLRMALYLAVLAPVGLWLLLPKRALWAVAVFIAGSFVAFMSGARMTIVMLALVAAGVYWRTSWRYKLPALIAILVALSGTVALVSDQPVVKERIARTFSLSDMTFAGIDNALSKRLTIWETAGRMLIDKPLTGIGPKAFRDAYESYSTRPDDPFRRGGIQAGGVYHAHQMYVSIAAETGLIGLTAVILAFALVVKWYLAASAARRAEAWPFAFALLVAVFPVNSQPVIYTHWWFPTLLLLLCAALAALNADDASERKT